MNLYDVKGRGTVNPEVVGSISAVNSNLNELESSQWCVIAHRHGGREAQIAWGGIREHDAFLGHEMRVPSGTGRGGVSMAGGREGQGARKVDGRLSSTLLFKRNV